MTMALNCHRVLLQCGIEAIHFIPPLSKSDVLIKYEPEKWCMKTNSFLNLEIDKIWQENMNNQRLFNGKKFRLFDFNVVNDKLVLKLGLTCYKDLLGTNLSPNCNAWVEKGMQDYEDTQAYMADPFGVGAVLVTSDHYLCLVERASWTGEYPGMIDRPGGHTEPERVPLLQSSGEGSGVTTSILNAVWDSILLEVQDEIGLSKDNLSEPQLLGILKNSFAGRRPSLEFFVRINLTADEVYRIYNKGEQKEFDESMSISFISSNVWKQLVCIINGSSDNSDINLAVSTEPTKENELSKHIPLHNAEELLPKVTPFLKGALCFRKNIIVDV